ncbi:hypothetical protein HK096_003131 [Nowakowskiella sp. JEL0078]|nr:hypothetical protein HK096_003131 [Nowakowskiella sp. JEL0078]
MDPCFQNNIKLGEILELGVQWSVKSRDIPSFERYISQLKIYYFDFRSILPQSPRMYPLLGANLMRLLAYNRVAEFHTELELLEDCINVFIKNPIELERSLMEGSYSRVWHARTNLPAEEYKLFVEMLVDTIREEIASCSESTYSQLPFSDAATLLYFKTQEELIVFAKEHNWEINTIENLIVFKSTNADQSHVPVNKVIHNNLQYARELERIV